MTPYDINDPPLYRKLVGESNFARTLENVEKRKGKTGDSPDLQKARKRVFRCKMDYILSPEY